jgi:D-lyxose ketol-isomerase
VRPYVPYALNESVDARIDDVTFGSGHVVAVHRDETYDIQMDSGEMLKKVSPMTMRRMTPGETVELVPGVKVMAAFPGYDEYFVGEIVNVNPDGTFAIQYEDGDFFPRVKREDIQYAV